MDTYALNSRSDLGSLMRYVQQAANPVVVKEGFDECFVAIRPDVFEALLFECATLECINRADLYF